MAIPDLTEEELEELVSEYYEKLAQQEAEYFERLERERWRELQENNG